MLPKFRPVGDTVKGNNKATGSACSERRYGTELCTSPGYTAWAEISTRPGCQAQAAKMGRGPSKLLLAGERKGISTASWRIKEKDHKYRNLDCYTFSYFFRDYNMNFSVNLIYCTSESSRKRKILHIGENPGTKIPPYSLIKPLFLVCYCSQWLIIPPTLFTCYSSDKWYGSEIFVGPGTYRGICWDQVWRTAGRTLDFPLYVFFGMYPNGKWRGIH